jgi:5-methyltetrahydrofolate--homocysteine methyltransferase
MQTTLRGKAKIVEIGDNKPTVVIGERINPTGRSVLAEALRQGNWDFVRQEAIKQVQNGAHAIDINVGVSGIDEVSALPQAVNVIAEAVDVPLSLDSSNEKALEAALKVCPGKPIVNSTTGELNKLKVLMPLVEKHGAAIIALCHDEEGIVDDPEKRYKVAEKILDVANQYGVPQEDIIFDPLVMSLGAVPQAALTSLETAKLISIRLGSNMTMGISNVSYGLPNRPLINNTLLVAALWCGVNVPIVNPMAPGLMDAILTADLLKGNDHYAGKYIKHYRETQAGVKT